MLKRIFDFGCSLLGFIGLSALFLAIAAAILLDSRGPVFYRGLRVGRFGKPFRIFKFRTMVEDAERSGASSTADDDARVTRVGRLLRKYKLDELPQLLNVLMGDMSLVGPRPQVRWAVDLYTKEEKAVLNVRPGITDIASIHFRHEGELLRGSADPDKDYLEQIHPEKMRLCLDYIRTQSFRLDCKILRQTVAAVLFRPGARKSEL